MEGRRRETSDLVFLIWIIALEWLVPFVMILIGIAAAGGIKWDRCWTVALWAAGIVIGPAVAFIVCAFGYGLVTSLFKKPVTREQRIATMLREVVRPPGHEE